MEAEQLQKQLDQLKLQSQMLAYEHGYVSLGVLPRENTKDWLLTTDLFTDEQLNDPDTRSLFEQILTD